MSARYLTLTGLLAGCFTLPGWAATDAANMVNPANSPANMAHIFDAKLLTGVKNSAPVLKLTHKVGKGTDVMLEIHMPGAKAKSLQLKTDGNVNRQDATATVERVASVANNVLLIKDSWASQPGPLAMCQAGQETFLRVIQLAPLREVLRLKLASCRDSLELATPGLTWQAEAATLTIHWLSGPNHTDQDKTLHIGSNGMVNLSRP